MYLNVQTINREMLRLFAIQRTTSPYVKHGGVLKQYHLSIWLGPQYFDPDHKEEHAASRRWSLDKFSEEFIAPVATKLNNCIPAGVTLISNPMELPAGLEAACDSWKGIGMRTCIAWDIAIAEEVVRFDVLGVEYLPKTVTG